MNSSYSELRSFSGKTKSIQNGIMFEVPEGLSKHSLDWPFHYVCTNFSERDLDFIPAGARENRYFDFVQDQFFGASLFFGCLIFYGPDLPIARVPNREAWKPLSIRFHNSIASPLSGQVLKIGLLNGYELQYGVWLNDKGTLSIVDQTGHGKEARTYPDIPSIIKRYDIAASGRHDWITKAELDHFIESLTTEAN